VRTPSPSSRPVELLTSTVAVLSMLATRSSSSTAVAPSRSRISTPKTTESSSAAAETARITAALETSSSQALLPSTVVFSAALTPTMETPARSPARARTRASTVTATRVTQAALSLPRLDLALMASTALLLELPRAARRLMKCYERRMERCCSLLGKSLCT
jgi:hypothetical protein